MEQTQIVNLFTGLYLLVMGIPYGIFYDKDRKILINKNKRIIETRDIIEKSLPVDSGQQGMLESDFTRLNYVMGGGGLGK